MSLSRSRREVANFKLNTLLEITEAINDNLETSLLLEKYNTILKSELTIGKCMLFNNSKGWQLISNYGFSPDAANNINIENDLASYEDITTVPSFEGKDGNDFDIVIPVFHKEKPMAYVIIGDIDENVQGMSPAIKHLRFIQTLTNIILVAIENQRLYSESLRQEALKKELELASKMQGMLIPDEDSLPKDDDFLFSTYYLPHLQVGGDFFDIIQLSENEIGFCIADVSGKGIAAALLMSNFQASLRALFTKESNLEELVIKLNDIVNRNAKGEKFLTMFLGRYNKVSRNLEYINSAHLPPLLYHHPSKEMNMLESGCIGMGMLDELYNIQVGNIHVKEGSKIICFTDGLTELKFGGEIRDDFINVNQAISNNKSIDENIKSIISQLNNTKDKELIFDDITIVGIQFM